MSVVLQPPPPTPHAGRKSLRICHGHQTHTDTHDLIAGWLFSASPSSLLSNKDALLGHGRHRNCHRQQSSTSFARQLLACTRACIPCTPRAVLSLLHPLRRIGVPCPLSAHLDIQDKSAQQSSCQSHKSSPELSNHAHAYSYSALHATIEVFLRLPLSFQAHVSLPRQAGSMKSAPSHHASHTA